MQLLLAAAVTALPLSATGSGNVIRDRVTGCGTSNPFPAEGESIRWYGSCQDGLLSGHGTLIWYQNGQETQRNEGTFWAGEMHGPITTTYPDRTQLIGTYQAGTRNGQFMTFRTDGSHTVSIFDRGQLISERLVSATGQLPPQTAPQPATTGSRQPAAPPLARPTAAIADRTATPPNWRDSFAGGSGLAQDTVVISGSGIENGYMGAFPPGAGGGYQVASAGRADAPRYRSSGSYGVAPPATSASGHTMSGAPDAAHTDKLTPRNAPLPPAQAPMPLADANSFYNQAYSSPPPVSQAGAAYSTPAYAQAQPAAPQAQIATPEQRFVAAFSAEQAGRTEQALASYAALSAQYPHSQAAQLAGERMAVLDRGSAVVQRAASPDAPAQSAPTLIGGNDEIGSYVCSLEGLFGGQSKWCGIVRDSNAAYHFIEVTRVKADGFFNIGFTRAPCTGNTFINYFSRGIRVTVPKNCMGPVW